MLRLLFDAQAVAVFVKLSHAIPLRVVDIVAKDASHSLFRSLHAFLQESGKACSVEDIVAQYQAYVVIADEFLADDESLGKSIRRRLLCVFEVNAQLATITEQTVETRQVEWGGDNQNILDASQHEYGDWVVYHRFVEDRNQLLADTFRNGVEACS